MVKSIVSDFYKKKLKLKILTVGKFWQNIQTCTKKRIARIEIPLKIMFFMSECMYLAQNVYNIKIVAILNDVIWHGWNQASTHFQP